MKSLALLLFAGGAATGLAEETTRRVTVEGTIANTTVQIESRTRITLSITGERVTATIATQPPLSGTGTLSGVYQRGWCELKGVVSEGFTITLRGALNAEEFRGTYVAVLGDQRSQHGRFQLAVTSK